MSNNALDQMEQEFDKRLMLLELEKELMKVLVAFATVCLEPGKKVELQPSIDQIINLFRKYKGCL